MQNEAETNKLLAQVEGYLEVLSQEFRSPLAVILSTLELLSSKLQQELSAKKRAEYEKLMDIAQRNVHKLLRVSTNVVEAGRVAKGCIAPAVQLVDVAQVLENILRATRSYAMAYGGDAVLHIETSNPFLLGCDRKMLDRILMNLISNAIKHFAPKNGLVELILRADDQEVCIEVRDNGTGLLPEQIPYVFEKYWSASNCDGAGLGLYVTDAFVRLHGGRIDVTSTPGEATSFQVFFPRTLPQQNSLKGATDIYDTDEETLMAKVEFSCLESKSTFHASGYMR